MTGNRAAFEKWYFERYGVYGFSDDDWTAWQAGIESVQVELERYRTALKEIGKPLAPPGKEDSTPTQREVMEEYTRRVAIAREALQPAGSAA